MDERRRQRGREEIEGELIRRQDKEEEKEEEGQGEGGGGNKKSC